MRRSTVVGVSALAVVASLVLVPAQVVAAPSHAVAPAGSTVTRAETAARSTLASVSGVGGTSGTLRLDETRALGGGDQVLRFQQVAGGVPVYAGEVAVQVDGGGDVLSVTGETAKGADGFAWLVAPA